MVQVDQSTEAWIRLVVIVPTTMETAGRMRQIRIARRSRRRRSTFGLYTCNDGIDNDDDGLTDADDPGCDDGYDGETNCFDNQDNDGDGLVDEEDGEENWALVSSWVMMIWNGAASTMDDDGTVDRL